MSGIREALLLFLRLPEPGQAKTRLIPRLGAEGAAQLYRRVAEETMERARSLARPGLSRFALIEPATCDKKGKEWVGSGFECHGQASGDLGRRMHTAFEHAFARGAQRVVVVGTDIPDLSVELLERAFEALYVHDAVLGPAFDGGYYLLGLNTMRPAVFRDIPWSASDTAATTLARLGENRCWTHRLPILRDLDTPEDLDVLFPGWST